MTTSAILAARESIEMKRGDKTVFVFTIRDSAGDPYDMSAYTKINMAAKSSPDMAEACFVLTLQDGISLTPPNVLTVTVEHTHTVNLACGSYHYDIQCSDDAGKVDTVIEGTLLLDQDITR